MTVSEMVRLLIAPEALPQEAKERVAGVIDLGPQEPQVFYVNPEAIPLLTSILKSSPRPLVIPDYVLKSFILQAHPLGLLIKDIELSHFAAASLKLSLQPLLEKGDYQAVSQFLSSTGALVNGIEFFDKTSNMTIKIYGSGIVMIEGESPEVQVKVAELLRVLLKPYIDTLVTR